jgi:hypothetical protein
MGRMGARIEYGVWHTPSSDLSMRFGARGYN